jgi:hypothetical protein
MKTLTALFMLIKEFLTLIGVKLSYSSAGQCNVPDIPKPPLPPEERAKNDIQEMHQAVTNNNVDDIMRLHTELRNAALGFGASPASSGGSAPGGSGTGGQGDCGSGQRVLSGESNLDFGAVRNQPDFIDAVRAMSGTAPKTLGEAQRRLPLMIACLIVHAYDLGYQLTFGDAYRDPRAFGEFGVAGGPYGERSSNHKRRLAVDFNLFKNGVFLTSTEDHKPLGEFWESIGGAWGGRFEDGNHYSVEFGGFK